MNEKPQVFTLPAMMGKPLRFCVPIKFGEPNNDKNLLIYMGIPRVVPCPKTTDSAPLSALYLNNLEPISLRASYQLISTH